MADLKISVITVCYNAANTLERCIQSVIAQNYDHVEYIIIDGASTDNTAAIIDKYRNEVAFVESKADKGIYDAMNKGITRATGNIIGLLNADDFYADNNVLNEISRVFTNNEIDALYADLDFINRQGNIVRKWRAGEYKDGAFNYGWMPPHPTFYCRKTTYMRIGLYSLKYGTAADYELMLRYIHVNHIKICYLNKVLVKMMVGGASNKSISNRLRSLQNDLKAMRYHEIAYPLIALLLKPVTKMKQFFNLR